jgi:hypothetical protein
MKAPYGPTAGSAEFLPLTIRENTSVTSGLPVSEQALLFGSLPGFATLPLS